MNNETNGDEWAHAVKCSLQALEDEKTVQADINNMYASWRFFLSSEEDREKMMAPLQDKLDEVRGRILSWDRWFSDYHIKTTSQDWSRRIV